MCSINQSNRSISVCLLFLYCSRVFISRSYENRSISFADIFSIYIFLLIRSSVDDDDDECEYIYSAQYTVPWVPQTFLAPFPVSVKSL